MGNLGPVGGTRQLRDRARRSSMSAQSASHTGDGEERIGLRQPSPCPRHREGAVLQGRELGPRSGRERQPTARR
eukprot:8917373-Pyramimonas_sp.AAC.1